MPIYKFLLIFYTNLSGYFCNYDNVSLYIFEKKALIGFPFVYCMSGKLNFLCFLKDCTLVQTSTIPYYYAIYAIKVDIAICTCGFSTMSPVIVFKECKLIRIV